MSYNFVDFTEAHKIPLTEIVCLRIVYAETARLFSQKLEGLLYFCLRNPVLFTHCLRKKPLD